MMPLGVLISGRGSNLKALIDACAGDFPARIAVVISNRAEAGGLVFAREAGIPAVILDPKAFADKTAFDQEVTRQLEAHGVRLVCLAGYMRLVSPWFVAHWHNRLINIHPSLLPSFKGLNAQRQALEAGVTIAGCTVHFVRDEMDSGPIILQKAVPVLPGDTEDTLALRILEQEHHAYPEAVRLIAEGRVRVEGERCRFSDAAPA